MKKIPLRLNSYISVENSNKHDLCWSSCPFNLRFKLQKITSDQRSIIKGPCLYFVAVSNEIVYVGKYQPKDGNVIKDRWIKHLSTISARGHRFSFGSFSRYCKVISEIENKSLKKTLEKAHSLKIESSFFKDSGHTTSKNRMQYASSNWGQFKNLSKQNFLESFSFHAFILKLNLQQEHIDHDISQIEKSFLEKIKLPCNKEFQMTNKKFYKPIRIGSAKKEILKDIKAYSNISNWEYLALQ